MEQVVARPVTGNRVITYDAVVRAGVGLFLRTATVEMDALAQRMAVSRATLYRVIPGRDQLLGDVLWRQAEVLFQQARVAAVDQKGAERVLAVMSHFGRRLMASAVYRQFLINESQTALRVLWTPAGRVHQRFAAMIGELLLEVQARGELDLTTAVDDLAYVLARIFESMWDADLMSERPPDLNVAESAARAVLQAG